MIKIANRAVHGFACAACALAILGTSPSFAQPADIDAAREARTRAIIEHFRPNAASPASQGSARTIMLDTTPSAPVEDEIDETDVVDTQPEAEPEERPPFAFNDILFALNSAEIDGESLWVVRSIADAMLHPALSDARFELAGHTDARGSEAYNQTLSERRAQSVRDALIDFGVEPRRLIAYGYGETRLMFPSNPNADENRRVELVELR